MNRTPDRMSKKFKSKNYIWGDLQEGNVDLPSPCGAGHLNDTILAWSLMFSWYNLSTDSSTALIQETHMIINPFNFPADSEEVVMEESV